MANYHKFQIGDLIAYKNSQSTDFLFGKDYGIVTGTVRGHDEQTWYKIQWADERRTRLSAYSYAQLELITPAKESCA